MLALVKSGTQRWTLNEGNTTLAASQQYQLRLGEPHTEAIPHSGKFLKEPSPGYFAGIYNNDLFIYTK